MIYEISEIKIIRKKFGLTQSELAKKSGVSQSLIAKIEAGKIDPAYSNVKKIFNFLDSLQQEHELKAGQIMRLSVISIAPETKKKKAISRMKKHGISQMPVIRKNECIGLVSEATILNNLLGKGANRVDEVMEDAPPIVSKSTSIDAVSELLRHTPIVIVSDKGKLKGIITKSDIIGKLSDYRNR